MQKGKGFDALRFFRDHRIEHTTIHHHCSPGWVNIHCPFCPPSERKNFHLGVEPSTGGVNCWRCGGHTLWELVRRLTKTPVKEVFGKYGGGSGVKFVQDESIIRPSILSLPPGTGPIGAKHKTYLEKRGFDPDHLIQEWGLLGTGPLGPYKDRIVIPVHKDGEMVSYTSRDITGRSPLRYKNCPTEQEVFPLKDTLYGLDKVVGDSVVVVEGPTDAWRVGPGAVATFGIAWTKAQMVMLTRFNRVSILFDKEIQAQKQAYSLANELGWVVNESVVIQGMKADDPGKMDKEEVERLRSISL